ncbi:MAG: mechanosensitive ion channel family protein [Eubacteriales bacterium]
MDDPETEVININGLIDKISSDTFKQQIVSFVTKYGVLLIVSLIVLLIGLKLIKYTVKLTKKLLDKYQVEGSVNTFLVSLLSVILKIILVIFVASILGAPVTSFVAILGTAGLAIGLALQGSLSNFAGGVLILILKPFKVGDYIKEDANGNEGIVEAIDIFYTTLKTLDNKVVVIPNGNLSNNSITNYSKKETRRVDLTVGVGYKDDLSKVKEALQDVVNKHPLILTDPESSVSVSELGDSSVNFLILVWCKTEDYWTVKSELTEQVKKRFDEEGINIPYPQMDVHMIQS